MNDLMITSDATPPVIRGFAADTWQQLLAELHAEFAPTDFFERIWLRDIAILPRRIDELRLIQSGVHSYELHRLSQTAPSGAEHKEQHDDGGTLPAWTHDPKELVAIQTMLAPLIGLDALTLQDMNPALARLLGHSYEQRLGIFSMLQSHIASLMIERDRVVGRYEEWTEKKQERDKSATAPDDILNALAASARLGDHD